ncbi:M23 family metallopeptidase [Roseofilum reptotaenium CS-1145]|nr:M23 family metallopeptidase [Roseofilum reptotaenium CS-1145]
MKISMHLAILGLAVALLPLTRVFIPQQKSMAQSWGLSSSATDTCTLKNRFIFIQNTQDRDIPEISRLTGIPKHRMQACHLFQQLGSQQEPVEGLQALTDGQSMASIVLPLRDRGYQVFSHFAIGADGVIPTTGGLSTAQVPERRFPQPSLEPRNPWENRTENPTENGDRAWVSPPSSLEEPQNQAPSQTTWLYPLENARISSGYGWRTTGRWGRELHVGVDFVAPIGTPVRATADGEVTFAKESAGNGGLTITLLHADGTRTLYAHLSKILVREGMQVRQGDTIGLVGNTGQSTGPHLHFEVYPPGVYGQPIDPCSAEYLNCSNVASHSPNQLRQR